MAKEEAKAEVAKKGADRSDSYAEQQVQKNWALLREVLGSERQQRNIAEHGQVNDWALPSLQARAPVPCGSPVWFAFDDHKHSYEDGSVVLAGSLRSSNASCHTLSLAYPGG